MVCRIIGQIEHTHGFTVHPNTDGRGKGIFIRHGIGIGIEARIMRAVTPHIIPVFVFLISPVLSVEFLGRQFRDKRGTFELIRFHILRPWNFIGQVAMPRAVDLQSIQHIPLFQRPGRIRKVFWRDLKVSPSSIHDHIAFFALIPDHKNGVVLVQDITGLIGQHRSIKDQTRFVRQGHRHIVNFSLIPGLIGNFQIFDR